LLPRALRQNRKPKSNFEKPKNSAEQKLVEITHDFPHENYFRKSKENNLPFCSIGLTSCTGQFRP
jgi:hypothetical protein